jgi:hypothetical protein
MLDTEGKKHILRICNTYWFSSATTIARTRLNVTLYVHCLSCLSLSIKILLHLLYFCETKYWLCHCYSRFMQPRSFASSPLWYITYKQHFTQSNNWLQRKPNKTFSLSPCYFMLFYVINVAYISVICHRLDVQRILVRFSAEARDLSLILCVQTGSGIHPASRWMDTGDSFTEGRATGAWRWGQE